MTLSDELSGDIAKSFQVSRDEIERCRDRYEKVLYPRIKAKYLSHLITTVEDLINEKRIAAILKYSQKSGAESERLAPLLQSKNIKLYSILLSPTKMKRRATTRYYGYGAMICYNPDYEGKQARILIAHELGHIVNKELGGIQDSENTANLFAFIAMKDKNEFYSKKSKEFTFQGDLSILREIESVCPLKKRD